MIAINFYLIRSTSRYSNLIPYKIVKLHHSSFTILRSLRVAFRDSTPTTQLHSTQLEHDMNAVPAVM